MATNRRSLLALSTLVLAAGAAGSWWSAHQKAQVGEQLARAAKPGDIHMLSSTTCSICTTTRTWFQRNGVAFEECFVEQSADCRALYEATRAPGTPVLLVRGVPQVGFDPQRVLAALSPAS
ncbi:MAG TPA: glutaredoxin domain-containing protein [Rubrivivax sp.]